MCGKTPNLEGSLVIVNTDAGPTPSRLPQPCDGAPSRGTVFRRQMWRYSELTYLAVTTRLMRRVLVDGGLS